MTEVRGELVRNLKERRNCRLAKRLSVQAQLLGKARQQIALKKRALERIDEMDANRREEMKMFQDSTTTLTNTIGNGFNMLHQLMWSQAPIYPQSFYSHGPQHLQRIEFVLDDRNRFFHAIMEDPYNFS